MANETLLNETIITATNKFTYVGDILKPVFTKLVVAVIVLLIGFIAGRLLGRLIQIGLSEIELNNLSKKITGARMKLEEFITHLAMYFIYFLTIIIALDIIGVTKWVLYLISIIIIIIIISSFLVSFKDFIPNMVAGLHIYRKNFIRPGSRIEVDNVKGKVIKIDLTETVIETKEGDQIHVPNSMLVKHKIVRKKS